MFETALSRRTAIAAGLTAAGASLVAQAGIAQADEAKAPKPVILVVSFGTSYNDSRHITIGAIEDAIRETYPDYDVRRAFTAQIIIDKLAERDGIVIDNFEQAMDKLVEEGVQKVIVQPTHLMAGYEYTDVLNSLQSNYADKFEAIVLGDPLLTSDEDYSEVVEAICDATAEYDDGQTAICFMGHGTEADSNEDYTHQLLRGHRRGNPHVRRRCRGRPGRRLHQGRTAPAHGCRRRPRQQRHGRHRGPRLLCQQVHRRWL